MRKLSDLDQKKKRRKYGILSSKEAVVDPDSPVRCISFRNIQILDACKDIAERNKYFLWHVQRKQVSAKDLRNAIIIDFCDEFTKLLENDDIFDHDFEYITPVERG